MKSSLLSANVSINLHLNVITKIRPSPHYAELIFKRNFISVVRPTVDTNPSRKWSFPEKLFKPEEFENAGLAF